MEVTLKKNGWHRKIQLYVFKNAPMFNNLCPYFWLTNFCILVTFIVPLVPIWRTLCWICRSIENATDSMSEYIDSHIKEPATLRRVGTMSSEDLLKAWALSGWWNYDAYTDVNNIKGLWYQGSDSPANWKYKKKECARADFDRWKEIEPNWEQLIQKWRDEKREKYEKLAEEREKQYALQRKKEQQAEINAQKAKESRAKMFSTIVKYTKWLGYILLTAAGIFFCIGVYKFVLLAYGCIQWMIAHFSYTNFIVIIKLLGGILGVLTFALGIVWFFRTFLYNCATHAITGKVFRALFSPLIWIGKKLLVPFFIKVWNVIEFFAEYIMAAKKDYCPGINWEEEEKK